MAIKKVKKEKPAEKETEKYSEATGRRKTAVARARVTLNAKKMEITVNGKNFTDYFKEKEQQDALTNPFIKTGTLGTVTIKTTGGGVKAQATASRHAISRALILINPDYKAVLKTMEYLTRDSRMKERKKPGLKGARRAPQWSKR